MQLSERVRRVVLDAVEEINRQAAEAHRIEASPETILLGEDSQLDSLGLVSLIVATEGKIRHEFGITLALVDS